MSSDWALAKQAIRRGTDARGIVSTFIPRCNDISPGGTFTCNLSKWHRNENNPHDEHEAFQPVPGGETIMTWRDDSDPRPAIPTGEPACGRYQVTGHFCPKRQPDAYAARTAHRTP